MNNFEEFENIEQVSYELEDLIEDQIANELLYSESPAEATEKMQNLLELEEKTENSRMKDKVRKVAAISHFKCNGSVVGNVIARGFAEEFLPKLEVNIAEDREEMTLEQLGDIVQNLEEVMENGRTSEPFTEAIARTLFNIYLQVNGKRNK